MKSVVETILKRKVSSNIYNYIEIVNIANPLLFTIDIENNTKIGFINTYAPLEGIIEFILTDVDYKDVIDYIENDKCFIDLFKNSITRYQLVKGKFSTSEVKNSDKEQYLPHKELKFSTAYFNKFNSEEISKKYQRK